MNNDFKWDDATALEFLNAHRSSLQIISDFHFGEESVNAFKKYKKLHSNTHTIKADESNVVDGGKDWEIINLKHKSTGSLTLPPLNASTEFMQHHLMYNDINSVKRLSDGEVFSSKDDTNHGRIDSFEIRDFGMAAVIIMGGGKCALPLNALKKAKQPLFTTTDGKAIYEGYEVYFILIEPENINYKNMIIEKGEIKTPNTTGEWKYFSTKEAAEEWVFENKPCLNVTDVMSVYDKWLNDSWITDESFKNALISLIKSKINK